MKVALCISGQLRSFARCFPTIKKFLIDPLNADVFMHVWTKTKRRDLLQKFKSCLDDTSLEKALELAKPVSWVAEEYTPEIESMLMDRYDTREIIQNTPQQRRDYILSATGMFHKIWCANELKKEYEKSNGFKYDLVIRARPDFLFGSSLSEEDINNALTENTIVNQLDNYAIKTGHNDKFCVGRSDTMDKYSEVILNLRKYLMSGCPPDGQEINTRHLRELQLKVEWSKIKADRTRPNKHLAEELSKKME